MEWQTLETALLELPVESRQHSILLMALLEPNATHQFSSSHCWTLARQVWAVKVPASSDLSTFATPSGGSWLMSAGAVPLSFTIWGLLPTVPLSNCVKTPCPEFKSHLKGEIALMFLATKRINSALPSTRMKPCTTGPRSNPMWMKVHSTFLVESGECWRIESGSRQEPENHTKCKLVWRTSFLKPFPMDFCLNLLMLKNGCCTKPSTSKHQPDSHEKTWHPTLVHSDQLATQKKDSFNSLTVLSAAPTDRCCCGAARRMENV